MDLYCDGQALYLVPTRYWENTQPIEVGVEGDQQGGRSVYVEQDGLNVYVKTADVFETPEQCNAEIARRCADAKAARSTITWL